MPTCVSLERRGGVSDGRRSMMGGLRDPLDDLHHNLMNEITRMARPEGDIVITARVLLGSCH